MRTRAHPFADRWNHNAHHYPRLRSLIPRSATRVLDIGCGDGTFCGYVASENRRVTGVDIDPAILPPPGGTASYAVCSADSLGLRDDSFDVVTMTMVLHHLHPARALLEARRVLAADGVLLILGIGRYGGWRDVPHEARDVVTHQLLSRLTTPGEPPTSRVGPVQTWAEARATAEALLPGCSYRRLPLWRYLVTWRKP